MIAATALAAVQALRVGPTNADLVGKSGQSELVQSELGQMGDLSLLLDRALDQIDSLAGVTRLVVEVESNYTSASVKVVGEGEEIERPAWTSQSNGATYVDPLTGSFFDWNPTAITCSFRIAIGLAAPPSGGSSPGGSSLGGSSLGSSGLGN